MQLYLRDQVLSAAAGAGVKVGTGPARTMPAEVAPGSGGAAEGGGADGGAAAAAAVAPPAPAPAAAAEPPAPPGGRMSTAAMAAKRADGSLSAEELGKLENMLDDESFAATLGGVSRGDFAALPKWKRDAQKKKAGLF